MSIPSVANLSELPRPTVDEAQTLLFLSHGATPSDVVLDQQRTAKTTREWRQAFSVTYGYDLQIRYVERSSTSTPEVDDNSTAVIDAAAGPLASNVVNRSETMVSTF